MRYLLFILLCSFAFSQNLYDSGLYIYINPKTQKDASQTDSLYDQQGNLKPNGEIINGTEFWTKSGLNDYAFYLDGTDAYVDFGVQFDTDTSDFIWTVAINPEAITASHWIINKGVGSIRKRYSFYLIDVAGTDIYRWYNNSVTSDYSPVALNEWYIFSIIKKSNYGSANDTLFFYKDSTPYDTLITGAELEPDLGTEVLLIGATATPNNFFQGQIGIVAAYLFDGNDGRPNGTPANYAAIISQNVAAIDSALTGLLGISENIYSNNFTGFPEFATFEDDEVIQ